jgi:hypothetical protein
MRNIFLIILSLSVFSAGCKKTAAVPEKAPVKEEKPKEEVVLPKGVYSTLASANDKWIMAMYTGLAGSPGYYNNDRVRTDAAGNIYIFFDFQGIVDIDPSIGVKLKDGTINQPNSGFGHQLCLAKYSPAGKYLWSKLISHKTGWIYTNSLNIDPAGNIYLAIENPEGGTFSIDDQQYTAKGIRNVCIIKLDNLGNIKWLNQINRAPGSSIFFKMITDALGNVYVVGASDGRFATEFHVGTNTIRSLRSDVLGYFYCAKYSTEGAYKWGRSITADMSPWTDPVISVDKFQNVYIAASAQSIPDTTVSGKQLGAKFVGTELQSFDGTFITKLNSEGKMIWFKGYGGRQKVTSANANEFANMKSITNDNDGNVYVLGSALIPPIGDVLRKVSPDGDDLWFRSIDAQYDNKNNRLLVNSNNEVLAIGQSVKSTSGHKGIYLYKYSATGNNIWQKDLLNGENASDLYLHDITQDKSGRITVLGLLRGRIRFLNTVDDPAPFKNGDGSFIYFLANFPENNF